MTVLALQAFLDETSESIIREIWGKLQEDDIWYTKDPNVRPHITFGSWHVDNVTDEMCGSLESASAEMKPLGIILSPSVVHGDRTALYLEPATSRELIEFHARIHELLVKPGEYFRDCDIPGSWQAHLTLGDGEEDDEKRVRIENLMEMTFPLEAVIEYFGLVTFGPIEYPKVCRIGV